MSVGVIEIVKSRSGHSVLQKNGRFMGSSIDPVREAEQWLQKAQAEIRAGGGAGSVILFGLGSGYQAKMLAEVLGAHAVLVIEPDLRVTAAVLALHPELRNVAVVGGDVTATATEDAAGGWAKLIESAPFRDFACARHTLLKNQVSVQQDPDYFANVERLLLGRERLGFLLQLKMRPELYGVLDAAKIEAVFSLGDRELVSVKTLQKLFSPQARITRERRMWKLLEELVV